MRRLLLPAALLALTACRADYQIQPLDDTLALEVTAPNYGEFMGDAAALVEGRVHPAWATVVVEGVEITPGDYGAFLVEVPVDHAYRIIDVEASYGDQWLRERVPVFQGHDPADTWPDGVTGRLLPEGLAVLGEQLGGMIDETGWADSLSASLPSFESEFVSVSAVGISHEPTVVVLDPAVGGIEAGIDLNAVTLAYEVLVDIYGYSWTTDITFAYGTVGLTALATPEVDADGIVWITLSETEVTLDDPDAEFGDLEGWVIEWILDLLNDYVSEPLAEYLLDWLLSEYGTFELGGPFAFEQDLMGTLIAAELYSLLGDEEGLALGMGVALGEELPAEPPAIATPGVDHAPEAHAAIGLHEGLLDLMVGDTVLDMLDQGMDLSGYLGDLIGGFIVNLPGGDEAPEGDGWCFSIQPGSAHVVRLQQGIDPLAVLYLPDLRMDVGVMDGSSCDDWLEASLALEIGLTVQDDGSLIGMDLEVVEGAVLSYGAEPGWDEAEVVDGLGGFLEAAMSLLGGSFELDLGELMGSSGDLFGGAFTLEPRIVDSVVLEDEEGLWIEGLYAVSMELFADE